MPACRALLVEQTSDPEPTFPAPAGTGSGTGSEFFVVYAQMSYLFYYFLCAYVCGIS